MLIALQNRLKALLEASTAFDGVNIVTEERPDLLNAIEQAIGRNNFIVVIGFAKGQATGNLRTPAALLEEEISIQFFQSPLYTRHNPVSLMEAAIPLIQNQPYQDGGVGGQRFFVVGHNTDVAEDRTRIVALRVLCTAHFTT